MPDPRALAMHGRARNLHVAGIIQRAEKRKGSDNNNNNNNNNDSDSDNEDNESIAARIARKRKPEPKKIFKSPRLKAKHGTNDDNNNNNNQEVVAQDNDDDENATPPPGKFVTLRSELHWAPHSSKTNKQKADDYVYGQAKANSIPPELQTNAAKNNRPEYRCVNCGGYFPRERDSRGKETTIQVDHQPPMSRRLEDAPRFGISGLVCDGTRIWFGILRKEALDCYNDPDMLQLMCDSCNPSKGGLKDYFRDEPVVYGYHDDKKCDADEHCG
jgi:hypothetical protein